MSTASSLVYTNTGMTRGRLPQRAGWLGLNGGGAAAAVPVGDGVRFLKVGVRERSVL